jgi:uncharacterized pyridoxamine 5'-phosphate oxidase family protein
MRRVIAIPALIAAITLGLGAIAANDVGKCPISGMPAKESSFRVLNGDKVYFCCDNCPKAYEKKLNVVDKGPDKCPISGKAAVASSRMLHKSSEMVYFCCDKCPKAFAKKNNFEFKETKPGKCPISGRDAKADSFLTVNGENIYFCCDNCPKAYLKKENVKDEGAKKCVVSGEAADADQKMIFAKTEAVYFCCDNCPKAYAKKHFATAAAK